MGSYRYLCIGVTSTPPTSTRYAERMVSVSRPLLAFAAARAQGTA
ncbi:unnamed protein product, partial [Ectocarpus sp. 6 AP-2014]